MSLESSRDYVSLSRSELNDRRLCSTSFHGVWVFPSDPSHWSLTTTIPTLYTVCLYPLLVFFTLAVGVRVDSTSNIVTVFDRFLMSFSVFLSLCVSLWVFVYLLLTSDKMLSPSNVNTVSITSLHCYGFTLKRRKRSFMLTLTLSV